MAKIETALAMLAGGGSVGEEFFQLATAALVQGLGCRWAGIYCLSDDKKSVRLLASTGVEAPLEPGLFALDGMPVAALYAAPSLGQLHITEDLAACFPNTGICLASTCVVTARRFFTIPAAVPPDMYSSLMTMR